MSKYWARTVVITGAIAVVIEPLWAHHSPSAVFEMTNRISVTGTLRTVDWINPHVVIAMEGKSDDGKIQPWTFESNPPSWYRSVGLALADFARAIGQTITVEGVRAKNGTAYGCMQKIKLPDGTTLNLFTAPGRIK
jgi:hypothetical protein